MTRPAAGICIILLLCLSAGCSCYDTHVRDTPALKRQLYTQLQGTNGCYKLLNATGFIGCEDPSGEGVAAPLLGLTSLETSLEGKWVVLIPLTLLDGLLQRMLTNSTWQKHVAGVLVDSTGQVQHSSQEPAFPLEAYAPYAAAGYTWNKHGSGVNRQYFPFPVYALTPELAEDAWRRAKFNAHVGSGGTLHTVQLKLTMNAQDSSLRCIQAQTCLPIGGHSVWAALPPLPVDPATAGSDGSKPIVLALAQVDGTALFHDLIQGAEAPLSGLFALLAAAQCLQQVREQAAEWPRRVVFVALAGEAWDLMGSRYMLYAMDQGTPNVLGLRLELVQQVIELGQVGQAAKSSNGSRAFFSHTERPTADIPLQLQLLSALQAAALATDETPTTLAPASPSTPGIPPSSLMAWLQVSRALPGVVLADFDTQFANPFYGSHLDGGGMVDAESVAAAGALLARTLFTLASGRAAEELKVDIPSMVALVQELTACWLSPSPGLLCAPITSLMAPDYYISGSTYDFAARHYIGVLSPMDDSQWDRDMDHPADPHSKRNMARFLWNYLANTTAAGGSQQDCDFGGKTCPAGEVCVGWKSSSELGVCLRASVSYVPARSTRVVRVSCGAQCYRWNLSSAADAWSQAHGLPEDPAWAESFWPEGHPNVLMYHPERQTVEVAVLVAGLALTLASLVLALFTKNKFHQRLKSH